MRYLLTISVALLGLLTICESAKINSENESIATIESLSKQLEELETEVTNGLEQEKFQWQLEVFQRWYQDIGKCSRDISYIFNGWTTIQRRMDGSLDFDRKWSEYRQGFGDEHQEYFIGLDKLHELTTSNEPQELLILLGDYDGKVAYARYDRFVVAGEEEKFELQELGKYSGTAGDSLSTHVGKKFSTSDEDNDDSRRNCAKLSQGGWWFNYCFESFLNAPYVDAHLKGESTKGMIWEAWRGVSYSLKYAQMLIRPKK